MSKEKKKRTPFKMRRKTWKVLDRDNMVEAIEYYAGNIIQIAEGFGVNRSAVYAFLKNHPEFEGLLRDARKILVGEAKQGLRNAIKREEGWAISLTLQTLGKDEGFVKGQIIGGGQDAQGQFTPVQITLPDNGRDPPDHQQLSIERLEAITEGGEDVAEPMGDGGTVDEEA